MGIEDVAEENGPASVAPEVRTRRLVVVDEHGAERAVIGVDNGHLELWIGTGRRGQGCEVLVFSGENDTGLLTAGVELCANGDGVGGESVSLRGNQIELHRYR
jgi:hypothetical protein